EAKDLRAVPEERAAALCSIDGWAGVQHGQMGHELDGSLTLLGGQYVQSVEQPLVGECLRGGEEIIRCHAPLYHGCFRARTMALAGLETNESGVVRRAR